MASTTGTSNAVAGLVGVLEGMLDKSYGVPAVSLLGRIIASSIVLVNTVSKLHDRPRSTHLADRVVDLVRHVKESVTSDPDAADSDIVQADLAALDSTLQHIERGISEELSGKNWMWKLRNLLPRARLGSQLEKHLETLDSAKKAYDVSQGQMPI
ncbi:uncharacterized protein LAESUDRAFT_176846 [Laetiporus sulphureus 93-53]|uniref:Fungal N-terminal domain-containing protein n=1 Tax=Laetiporus sulphureus 93-53 TaxID=1314785 RepID=A0A165E7V8_9APHY|nr:uncharacterized protein LAESUDRAFT_176846 [Laetiporus sulphureus 93-53]KZT06412.1 hypothetical protein LAESUDRAFT_176846 [Laetiporus sulphureus 93-53]